MEYTDLTDTQQNLWLEEICVVWKGNYNTSPFSTPNLAQNENKFFGGSDLPTSHPHHSLHNLAGCVYYKPHHSFRSPSPWVTLMSGFIFLILCPNKLLIPNSLGRALPRSLKLASWEPNFTFIKNRTQTEAQWSDSFYILPSLTGLLQSIQFVKRLEECCPTKYTTNSKPSCGFSPLVVRMIQLHQKYYCCNQDQYMKIIKEKQMHIHFLKSFTSWVSFFTSKFPWYFWKLFNFIWNWFIHTWGYSLL